MSKQRLGRGLGSLISSEPPQAVGGAPAGGLKEIEIARVDLNPQQPRQWIDPEALAGLADSMRSAGVLQPIVVRPKGEMFELVMGERRLRAAHMAGLERIAAVVRDVADDQMVEFALIENIQREDLNPVEKAMAVSRMIGQLGLTQEAAGDKIGMDRSSVANLLRLLDLPAAVLEMVSRGTLSAGHARAILALEGEASRVALAQKVVADGLSVRQTERLVAAGLRPGGRCAPIKTPQIRHLETALRERLGAKVDIRSRGNAGRLVIHFEDPDDFERIFELLLGPEPPQHD